MAKGDITRKADLDSLVQRGAEGRMFSQEALVDVIALAESFQRFDTRKADGSLLDVVGKQLHSIEGYSTQTM